MEALALLNPAPVAIYWLGAAPDGLRSTDGRDWRHVYSALAHLLDIGIPPLRLAPVRGVKVASGRRLDRVEVLENLLVAYPLPLPADGVSTERTTRINRLLASAALPWKVTRRRGQLYLKKHQEVLATNGSPS